MVRTFSFTTGITAAAIASATALALAGTAVAEPAAPAEPVPAAQTPGLPAIEQLSPVIQQAAADPQGAVELLMAAAAAFKGNTNAPADSRQVADSVTEFIQADPVAVAHMPGPGVEPGTQAHIPTGINPANAVGPVPVEVPHAPAAQPAPGPVPPQAEPPAPEAAPVAVDGTVAEAAPAPAPRRSRLRTSARRAPPPRSSCTRRSARTASPTAAT